jgi:putative membrane protein
MDPGAMLSDWGPMKREHVPVVLLVLALAALGASAVGPTDRLTWWLEIAPVMAGVAIVVPTVRRFPLSHLLYTCLFVHAIILVVGGHYTYAQVPAGLWLQDLFDLSRNHYDRLGHLAQGFVPAVLAREILIRRSPLAHSRWLPFVVICVCLAFSAFYELIEWWVSLALGQSAGEFLGTQGDVWDTQWDMFLALVGAVAALVTLAKAHDRSLARLAEDRSLGRGRRAV